ncbi:M56 family metallopeptidase [Mycolicibacterium sp. HK-90]|uniref:M56 family metallopeptidase n=1 Tax=Mycolicibacterium sp. HK-90 TaxID=3056937 RepID=UPI00265B5CFB|nr:M56 family metallopeptidase [Mycolicibacterium sp. HK-90]WKG00772.1 M56 family metallopeptidase [Mycolicibacterium sp. HK-90]
MNVAAGLLIYSAAMVVLAPPLLGALTRGGSAPRFGVAVWLIAIVSVLATWVAIPALILADVVFHDGRRGSLLSSCVRFLCELAAGRVGIAAQLTVVAVAVGLLAAGTGVAIRVAGTIRRLHAHAHDHAQAVRLVGRPAGQPDVFIVDSGERTAYCVAGRPPAIVVTSGALAALDRDGLQAVLAHERAHLDGHHPAIVTALRGLATVFPRMKLITSGAREIPRLLEMCADDAAVRHHGQHPLLTGLMALAGATPAQALGAADVALLSRAERLVLPPAAWSRISTRVGLCGAMTVIFLVPVATFVLGTSGLFCR